MPTPNHLKQMIKKVIKDKPADMSQVREVIKLILANLGSACADDVRFHVKSFMPSANIIGTAFHNMEKEGLILKSMQKKSNLKSAHGRSIWVYEEVR